MRDADPATVQDGQTGGSSTASGERRAEVYEDWLAAPTDRDARRIETMPGARSLVGARGGVRLVRPQRRTPPVTPGLDRDLTNRMASYGV